MSNTQFHPSYNSQDGDLVLSSSDNVLFRVNSDVMRRASGFFKEMYEMPRSDDEKPGPLTATANTVATALDIIYPDRDLPAPSYPIGLPAFTTPCLYDFVEQLQSFADSYSMPKVTLYVRSLIATGIASDSFRSSQLQLFALCCEYGWEEEAKQASTGTLDLDLKSPECDEALDRLSVRNLRRLQDLHYRRRRAFLDVMEFKSPDLMRPEDVVTDCLQESSTHTGKHYWPQLKLWVSDALEKVPQGTILADSKSFDCPELELFWNYICKRKTCRREIYSKERILSIFCRLVNSPNNLPNTI
ncbi:hypothetical protein BD410DRAFT_524829 [Rickenella mellea]|uniref:BTB domain-containing protein n=1 Tax=Rickenella mellea TaxID=50990 RepID=A0A4Y7QH47_9AGAM|nr:hypothetical protein BD410DRAFT_524829 [Rickenella mellea]